MRNKQGKLQILIHKGKYNIVTIFETWWDEIHDWNIDLNCLKETDQTKEEVEIYYV